MSFFDKFGKRVGDLVLEFLGTFVAIAGIGLTDKFVKWWLGADAKFFDTVPVAWVFDLAHICLIARLIWRIFFPEKES